MNPSRTAGERLRINTRVDQRVDMVSIGIAALLVGLLASMVFFLLSGQEGVDAVNRTRAVDDRLAEAAQEIRYLDEVLTHSTARFAATGDPAWKTRYDDAVVALDAVLAIAYDLAASEDLEPLQRVDDANQALIAVETRVFELGSQGRLDEARALLLGEYERQKAIYSNGVDEFYAAQVERVDRSLGDVEQRLNANLAVGLALTAVLILSMLLLLRVHRREHALTFTQARQLRDQARVDPLTGLPNRLGAIEVLDAALGSGRPVAALFVDLDGFKAINDSFGHGGGDEVLVQLAHRFRDDVGTDGTVARLGGDEFLVIVADEPRADRVAERLLAAAARPVVVGGVEAAVTASIGHAAALGGSGADLLRRADQAVYAAKQSGRFRIARFDDALRDQVDHVATIERELKAAISNDELVIQLQPLVDTLTGATMGAEALVRWDHPRRGLLMPGAFVPIAETSWLVVEIGRKVLAHACALLAEWQRQGRREFISVNISARHVIHGDIVGDLIDALGRSGADGSGLSIELTETHLIDDLDVAFTVLTRVRQHGVTVSLDDFGSGHASLGYMRRLPLDTLKIDRSYVSGVDRDEQYALVSIMVQLGRTLGLRLVAEGVETEAELDALRRLGCDVCQGYLIARPMPVDVYETWAALNAVDTGPTMVGHTASAAARS